MTPFPLPPFTPPLLLMWYLTIRLLDTGQLIRDCNSLVAKGLLTCNFFRENCGLNVILGNECSFWLQNYSKVEINFLLLKKLFKRFCMKKVCWRPFLLTGSQQQAGRQESLIRHRCIKKWNALLVFPAKSLDHPFNPLKFPITVNGNKVIRGPISFEAVLVNTHDIFSKRNALALVDENKSC